MNKTYYSKEESLKSVKEYYNARGIYKEVSSYCVIDRKDDGRVEGDDTLLVNDCIVFGYENILRGEATYSIIGSMFNLTINGVKSRLRSLGIKLFKKNYIKEEHNCKLCGNSFKRYRCREGKYCSHKCYLDYLKIKYEKKS